MPPMGAIELRRNSSSANTSRHTANLVSAITIGLHARAFLVEPQYANIIGGNLDISQASATTLRASSDGARLTRPSIVAHNLAPVKPPSSETLSIVMSEPDVAVLGQHTVELLRQFESPIPYVEAAPAPRINSSRRIDNQTMVVAASQICGCPSSNNRARYGAIASTGWDRLQARWPLCECQSGELTCFHE